MGSIWGFATSIVNSILDVFVTMISYIGDALVWLMLLTMRGIRYNFIHSGNLVRIVWVVAFIIIIFAILWIALTWALPITIVLVITIPILIFFTKLAVLLGLFFIGLVGIAKIRSMYHRIRAKNSSGNTEDITNAE